MNVNLPERAAGLVWLIYAASLAVGLVLWSGLSLLFPPIFLPSPRVTFAAATLISIQNIWIDD